MKIRELTNAELIRAFENACFLACNYPSNKSKQLQLRKLENELARRLNVRIDELRELLD